MTNEETTDLTDFMDPESAEKLDPGPNQQTLTDDSNSDGEDNPDEETSEKEQSEDTETEAPTDNDTLTDETTDSDDRSPEDIQEPSATEETTPSNQQTTDTTQPGNLANISSTGHTPTNEPTPLEMEDYTARDLPHLALEGGIGITYHLRDSVSDFSINDGVRTVRFVTGEITPNDDVENTEKLLAYLFYATVILAPLLTLLFILFQNNG